MGRRKGCDQCQVLMINGVYCHETGCPNAWKDSVRECKWCGRKFKPRQGPHQDCCCAGCRKAYHGT